MSPFLSSSRTFFRFRSVSTWQKTATYYCFVSFFSFRFPSSWSVPDVEDFTEVTVFYQQVIKRFGPNERILQWKVNAQHRDKQFFNFAPEKDSQTSRKLSLVFIFFPFTHAVSALKDLRHCNGTNWFWMELLSVAALVCYWDIFLTKSWVETSLHMFLTVGS